MCEGKDTVITVFYFCFLSAGLLMSKFPTYKYLITFEFVAGIAISTMLIPRLVHLWVFFLFMIVNGAHMAATHTGKVPLSQTTGNLRILFCCPIQILTVVVSLCFLVLLELFSDPCYLRLRRSCWDSNLNS